MLPAGDAPLSIPSLPVDFLLAGRQLQHRVGRFSAGGLHHYFSISPRCALTKLLVLATPYLRRWNYTRRRSEPPRGDPAAPDLYLPLVSMWTYALLLCADAALQGQFKPDMLHASAWSAGVAWVVHAAVACVLLRAMGLPPSSAPWVELLAYTGYAYVPVCASLALGMAAGKWAYRVSWLYGSLCMSVFLVRTVKAALQEAWRGLDRSRINYLLLALAVFQFPLAAWLGGSGYK